MDDKLRLSLSRVLKQECTRVGIDCRLGKRFSGDIKADAILYSPHGNARIYIFCGPMAETTTQLLENHSKVFIFVFSIKQIPSTIEFVNAAFKIKY